MHSGTTKHLLSQWLVNLLLKVRGFVATQALDNALTPPPPQNRNRFLFLTQLVVVAGGVLIFGGGSYCV